MGQLLKLIETVSAQSHFVSRQNPVDMKQKYRF